MTRLHGKTEEKAETMVHGDKHLTAKKYIYIYIKRWEKKRDSVHVGKENCQLGPIRHFCDDDYDDDDEGDNLLKHTSKSIKQNTCVSCLSYT